MDKLEVNLSNIKTYEGAMNELRKIRSFMQERGMSYEDAHEAAFEAYNLGFNRMEKIFRDSADES